MPKIFEYFGFIFLFYSNEHEPIHVHVMKDGHEAIFEIMLENGELVDIHRRTSNKIPPLSEKDAATAEAFVKKYYKNIVVVTNIMEEYSSIMTSSLLHVIIKFHKKADCLTPKLGRSISCPANISPRTSRETTRVYMPR